MRIYSKYSVVLLVYAEWKFAELWKLLLRLQRFNLDIRCVGLTFAECYPSLS